MTRPDWTRYPGVIASLVALAAMLLVASGFARSADVEALEARVYMLESRLSEIERGVVLTNCLQLSDLQGTPWQACLRQP